MTLEQRLILLAQAIGADIKTLTVAQGSLTSLTTTAKSNLVAAINELKSITDGGAAINDAAGDGDTTVTWSADKIFDSIAAAKAALKNELLDGAGAALDTLNELGDALNNDPNAPIFDFAHVGIVTAALQQQRRMLCRPCLDWSERRHHLGGALGAALLQRLFDGGWAHRAQDSRVVHFTPKGELALRQWLATHPDAPNPSAAQGPAPC